MKVIDALIALQKLDPNIDLAVDMTKDGSGVFRFVLVESIEEIGLPDDTKIAAVFLYDTVSIDKIQNN